MEPSSNPVPTPTPSGEPPKTEQPTQQPSAGSVIGPSPEASPPAPTPITATEQSASPQPVPLVNPEPPVAPKKRSKKPLIIGVIIAFLLILSTSAYVFGYYIPNQPENVWKTGLNRSGEVLSTLAEENTEAEKIESFKKSEISSTLSVTSDVVDVDGELTTKFDDTSSDSALSINLSSEEPLFGTDQTELALKAFLLTKLAEDSAFPDIFFKVSGFKDIKAVETYYPGLVTYDDKWISVSSDYLESTLGSYVEAEDFGYSSENELTAEETAAIAKAVTDTLNEYVFTDDDAKGIIEQREFIGKEDLDDINTYHYKAGYRFDNLAPFCRAMVDNVLNVEGTDKFFRDTEAKKDARVDAQEACDKSVSDEDRQELEDFSFDVWIDSKYKLIHKIRFTDEDNEANYIDIGQRYTGGDDVTFFAHIENGDVTANLELNNNFDSLKTVITVNVDVSGDTPFTIKSTTTVQPYQEEITTTPPEAAVDIQEFLSSLETAAPAVNGLNTFLQ